MLEPQWHILGERLGQPGIGISNRGLRRLTVVGTSGALIARAEIISTRLGTAQRLARVAVRTLIAEGLEWIIDIMDLFTTVRTWILRKHVGARARAIEYKIDFPTGDDPYQLLVIQEGATS